MKAAVLGGSGYIGGELLRLLLAHPFVKLVQATSDRLAGKPLTSVHPQCHRADGLKFSPHDEIAPCDVLFMSMKHGYAREKPERWLGLAPYTVDLSGDFRLRDAATYKRYYHAEHNHPDLIPRFVAGLPELFPRDLEAASHVAVPGCMASAAVLALYPLAANRLIKGEVIVDARTGSSGSGASASIATHHAIRSGAMRVFQAVEHRHEAEISQACDCPVRMSATAVEAVRGVQVLAHCNLQVPMTDRDVWAVYRQYYREKPFVRMVKKRTGPYRLPEPKLLTGTNYCDVGFQLSSDGLHVVVVSAIDNLMKGGAGAAVQCLNVRMKWSETAGLEFDGLHPV